MSIPIQETATKVLDAPASSNPGTRLVQFLSPGWGSSGYYSPQVIEQAVADGVIAAGTQMYADHPTKDEDRARPVRSIKDLAAVVTENARIATEDDLAAGADPGAAVGEVRIFAPWRDAINEMADAIGTSIRGDATDIVEGQAEGRAGKIVQGLAHVKSVDFVTKAGRGGKLLALAESASVEEARNIGQWIESRIHRDFTVTADDMAGDGRLTREERIQLSSAIGDALAAFVANLEANAPELYQRDIWDDPADTVAEARTADAAERINRRAIGRGVAEATANDIRDQLSNLVRETYVTGEGTWAYLRDFDDTTAWFEASTAGQCGLFSQAYESDTSGPTALTGERTEVRAVTTYVPATRPDESTTESHEENQMGTVQIEESEHTRLTEAAGRVTALEERATTAEARAELAESKLATRDRADRARVLISEAAGADVAFTSLEEAGLLASLPLTDAGELNESVFTTTVQTEVAKKKQAAGVGQVRSFGGTTTGVQEDAGAKVAAIDASLGIQKGA